MTSSPLAAPFKVLLEDLQRIVCIEFQCTLLLSVLFVDILSLKVAIFSEVAKIDKQLNIRKLIVGECAKIKRFLGYIW